MTQTPGPSILVVDDDSTLLILMEMMLDEAGYTVHVASSVVEALHVLSHLPNPPAVVITELRMAPVDGARFATMLRELLPEMPVLFVSRFGPRGEYGQLPGPLLAKPFPRDAFLKEVNLLCGAGGPARDR